MSVSTSPNIRKQPESNRTYGVDFGPLLQSGVTVSSVSKEEDPTGIVVGTPAVNTALFTDPDGLTTIAANEGYKVVISGGKAGNDLAMHASNGNQVVPAGGTAATDVGKTLHILDGIGFTQGRYTITAQDGTNWTLDRDAGAVGSTQGTYGLDYILRVSYTDSAGEVDVATTVIEVRV